MADTYLTWWTSIETDIRKSIIIHAMRDVERLHALVRMAYERGHATATPPSPSTAPEGAVTDYGTPVDERAAFEAWHRRKFETKHSTGQPTRDMHNGIYAEQYGPVHQQQMWEAWTARAALASRPAEVDDEGLPPLPEPKYCADDLTDIFTAEQFRQGQRDAVAADRAREWFVVGGRRVGRTYMAKLAHDAARYRWLRESNNVEAVSIVNMHSGDSMDARVDQAMALAAAQLDAK